MSVTLLCGIEKLKNRSVAYALKPGQRPNIYTTSANNKILKISNVKCTTFFGALGSICSSFVSTTKIAGNLINLKHGCINFHNKSSKSINLVRREGESMVW